MLSIWKEENYSFGERVENIYTKKQPKELQLKIIVEQVILILKDF